jgi:RNA 3'-terminal phosphate cyclase (ATP)
VIDIDGSEGEGGGQLLRSSLSLAICTQQPFRITNIRANRAMPGLMRQHLTAVNAAAGICDARVEGAEIGSRALVFRPGKLHAGDFSFAIGTAGSCTLVLQTLLLPLLAASAKSRVRVTGGTHNPAAPPFEFLQRSFVPLLERMGARIGIELASFGFYPRGGGEIRADITPVPKLGPLSLLERGAATHGGAEAYIAGLPASIATRELDVIGKRLGWAREQLHLRPLPNDVGPGNAVTITLGYENVTEVFAGFGERGVRAEDVALAAANEALGFRAATAPVGEHLADQLLLPLALGAGGTFLATRASGHLHSNAEIVRRFTGRRVSIISRPAGVEVTI